MSALTDTLLDDCLKGIPPGRSLTLGAVSEQGWNVARGDLSLPALTLDQEAVHANIVTMQRYCDRHRVRLAPHGKTTMAPQLFEAQLRAGAWGITAATPTQVAVMRRHGIGRIILANELIDRPALHWLATELDRDPDFDFLCLVDGVGTARRMDAILAESACSRPLAVLVEVGGEGGRAGARSSEAACEVAAAVHEARHLQLAGIEAFEGTYATQADDEGLARIDDLLDTVRASLIEIAAAGLFERDEVIVTAGGSMYFDRVIDGLGSWPEIDDPVKLVLRSGCYVSHDNGTYERLSALGARHAAGESLRLRNALTLWATVLSRPEPELIILGAGLRDAPVDRDLPVVRTCFRDGRALGELAGAQTYRVMDQHLFVRVDPSADARAGDIIALDLSHPCTAFDKFGFIPFVDERFDVRGGVLTFF